MVWVPENTAMVAATERIDGISKTKASNIQVKSQFDYFNQMQYSVYEWRQFAVVQALLKVLK